MPVCADVDVVADAISGLRLRPDPETKLDSRPTGSTSFEVCCSADNGLPGLRLEVDLGAAVGYWHPGPRGARPLPPDWTAPTVTSIVRSAPVGVLYDGTGQALLGWAAAEAAAELSVRFGVSEERKAFVVEVRPIRPLDFDLILRVDVDSRAGLAEAVADLGVWLSSGYPDKVLPVPVTARRPVYSTWYTFTQDMDAHRVVGESALAAEIGCGTVFIDDGWQQFGTGRGYQGCGDWLPDQSKFGDLAGTVETIHSQGSAVALWVAPLLLGPESDAYSRLGRFAPEFVADQNCQVLDPRQPETRAHVVEVCTRLVLDFNVDMLKIDFLDTAMTYGNSADRGGDFADVGRAMAAMMAEVRGRLRDVGRSDVVFEFRQPYVSPVMGRFGQILRANDCPADSATNRASTIDARLMSVGQVIHADPMMWGLTGGAQAVAQQLYSGWFSVPQISMPLSTLPPVQTTALRGLLELWQHHSEVVLDGRLHVFGAERGYDLLWAVRHDLGRSVIARYAPLVIDLDRHPTAEISIINATTSDRLVVRTTRPVIDGKTRSAYTTQIGSIGPLAAGILEVDCPPFGSVDLRFRPAGLAVEL